MLRASARDDGVDGFDPRDYVDDETFEAEVERAADVARTAVRRMRAGDVRHDPAPRPLPGLVRAARHLPQGAGVTAVGALTDEQQRAVEARGLVFVTAGAGSGKTRVLVERVARAVEDGVDPDRLVVVTFTERATRELSERVRERLAGTHPEAAARVRISTIHGLCRRILQEHALAAGLDPDVGVLQEDEAAILRREAFDLALAEAVDADPDEMLDLIASYGIDRLAEIIVEDLHATLRSAGHPPDVVLFDAPDLAAARGQADAAASALLAAAGDDAAAGERAGAMRERAAGASPSELVDLSARAYRSAETSGACTRRRGSRSRPQRARRSRPRSPR